MTSKLFILLSVIATINLVSGSAYIGCFDPGALEGGGGVLYDNRTTSCPEIVSSVGSTYSNSWPFAGDNSNFYACRAWDEPLNSSFLVSGRQCGYPNVNVTIVDPPTQWTWAGCWYLHDSPLWADVANISTCLASCENYPYAYSRYNSDLTISCLCSTSQPPYDYPLDCGYGDNFWYTHPVLPSGFAKRQAKAKIRRDKEGQLIMGLCPGGRRACNVPESNGLNFECIDTDYELESCGGCVNGDYSTKHEVGKNETPAGVDCTSLPGIAFGGVSCHKGTCVAYSCEEGYVLVNQTCVEE